MEREKKTETLAMKVQSSLFARLNEIAEAEDRPIGYVARELMIRGLSLYESDGMLRDQKMKHVERGSVVARIDPAPLQPEEEDLRDVIRRQLEPRADMPQQRRKAG